MVRITGPVVHQRDDFCVINKVSGAGSLKKQIDLDESFKQKDDHNMLFRKRGASLINSKIFFDEEIWLDFYVQS